MKEVDKVDSTCHSKGSRTLKCDCGYEKTEEINEIAHASEWRSDGAKHWQVCTAQGCTYKSAEEAHGFDNGTFDGTGLKLTYKCGDCKYTYDVQYTKAEQGENNVSVTHGESTEYGYFKFTAEKSGLYRVVSDELNAKITLTSGDAVREYIAVKDKDTGRKIKFDFSFNAVAGESYLFKCDTADETSANYSFSVYAPGTENNPLKVNANYDGISEEITIKANEKLYYMIMGGYAFNVKTESATARLVLDTVTNGGADGFNVLINALGIGGAGGKSLSAQPLADSAEEGVLFYFTAEEDLTFTVQFKQNFEEGTYDNPVAVTLDTVTHVDIAVEVVSVGGRNENLAQELYYAFVPEESGWYKFSSTGTNAALISAGYDRYGDNGNGFDFRVYLDTAIYKDTNPYKAQLTSATNEQGAARSASYDFKVEKTNAPAELAIDTPANVTTENSFFTFTADADAEYTVTVSGLEQGSYWRIEYTKSGIRQVEEYTQDSATVTVKNGDKVYIVIGGTATSVTLEKSEIDPFALGLGKSAILLPDQTYTFTVPEDGDYKFTFSSKPINIVKWTIEWNGTSKKFATGSVAANTLTGFVAGDVVEISYTGTSNKYITIAKV